MRRVIVRIGSMDVGRWRPYCAHCIRYKLLRVGRDDRFGPIVVGAYGDYSTKRNLGACVVVDSDGLLPPLRRAKLRRNIHILVVGQRFSGGAIRWSCVSIAHSNCIGKTFLEKSSSLPATRVNRNCRNATRQTARRGDRPVALHHTRHTGNTLRVLSGSAVEFPLGPGRKPTCARRRGVLY